MDCFQGHQHTVRGGTYDDWAAVPKNNGGSNNQPFATTNYLNDGVNGNPRVGKETRPVNYTIKVYKRIL